MAIRTEILEAATRMFATYGFEGTSLQAIADAVGIRKPSLLYHFSSKQDLWEKVFAQVVTHWNQALPKLLTAMIGGEERFEAVSREMIAFFSADPDRARLVLRELMDRPAQMREAMATIVRPWIGTLAKYIRAGQAEGMIDPAVDPDAYVAEIMMLVLSTVATSTVLAELLPSGSGRTTRLLEELMRIGRKSLFLESVGRSRRPRRKH